MCTLEIIRIQTVNLRRDEVRNLIASQRRQGGRNSTGKPKGWFANYGTLSVCIDGVIFCHRTHRERKEQYIKALETEMSRLRERYAGDTVMMKNTLEQHRNALADQQTENMILKDILASRGIGFQTELESRKAVMMMQPRSGSFGQSNSGSRSGSYGQISPTVLPASGRSPHSASGPKYSNGRLPSTSETSTMGGGFRGHSSAEPGISEQAIKREPRGISDMPGIFERNQQLGIDFILA